MCPQLWVIVCVVESPSVRLPRKYFCRVETHLRVVVALSGWWCGWPVMVVLPHGAWLVDASGLRDKRVNVLVHCWVSGAAQGCSCWALMLAGRLGCGWLCVGVVLCENCIVDASIFLFCVLVFVP